MKKSVLVKMTALLGLAALALRSLLYLMAVDEKNLLVRFHPLEIALGILTAVTLGVIVLAVRKETDLCRSGETVWTSFFGALGNLAAGCGILVTVLTGMPMLNSYLGIVWQTLGLVSPVCLLLAGMARVLGKKPWFLLYLVPSLFFAVHIVNNYQLWSGNPQLQDYVFSLLGAMALMFFAFYKAASGAGCENRRMEQGAGLAAVYLCMAELARSSGPTLYLGGLIWMLTEVWSVPAAREERD